MLAMLSKLRGAGLHVFVAGFAAVAAYFAWRRLSDLPDLSQLQPGFLILSLALLVTTVVMYACTWASIVVHLTGSAVRRAPLVRFFLLTWPGRYVPGTLPYHAARVAFAERLGVSRRVVAASVGYEAILQLGAATLVGALCLLLSSDATDFIGGGLAPTLLLLCLLPPLLHPQVLSTVASVAMRLLRRPQLEHGAFLTLRVTSRLFLGCVLVHVIEGVAFYLLVTGLFGGSNDPLLAVGAYNLAGAAGVAVLFVPSGLGVREAVLAGLMSATLSPEEAILAAGLARALSVVADLIPVAAVLVLGLGTRLLQATKTGRRSKVAV
jgi:uncharacterized membrane protein YbhN (UPF0104 family)